MEKRLRASRAETGIDWHPGKRQGCQDQARGSGGEEKGTDSEWILKVEPPALADDLDMVLDLFKSPQTL